jgi:hypothetical protein
MQMWLGSVTASRTFPTLNVAAHLKTPQQQPSARHGGNLQRASPNLWVSCFSFFVHCISLCFTLPLAGATLFIVLNGFGVSLY